MTDPGVGRRDWTAWWAGAAFALFLAAVLGAGAWFALRDARSAALAAAELEEKPAARIEGASFDTTYSAYSVQAPPLADAMIRGGVLTSAPATAEGRRALAVDAPDAPADGSGYRPVSFSRLAGFQYGKRALSTADGSTSDSRPAAALPPDVQALDGQKVNLSGYMMPIDFEGGRVRSFLLMRNQLLCCFGISPRLNDFVAVSVADRKGVPAVQDIPIRVKGTLQVGEVVENGIPLALYTMIADEVRTSR